MGLSLITLATMIFHILIDIGPHSDDAVVVLALWSPFRCWVAASLHTSARWMASRGSDRVLSLR